MKLAHLTCSRRGIVLTLIFSLLIISSALRSPIAMAGPNIWTNIGPAYLGSTDNYNGTRSSVVASDAQGNLYLTNVSSADSSPTVVYRSSDGGATWQRVGDFAGVFPPSQRGLGFPSPYLAVSPRGDTLFVSISSDGLANHTALLRSDDRGATWHVATNNWFFYQIIFDPTDNNRLYASGADAANYGHGMDNALYRSNDGGSTWVALNQSGLIAIDPANPQHLVTSKEAVSTDGGDTWQQLPAGHSHNFAPVFLSSPNGSSTMLLVDNTAVSRSNDGGITKEEIPYARQRDQQQLWIETVASSPSRVYLLVKDTAPAVSIWSEANYFVYSSSDGINWVAVRSRVQAESDDAGSYEDYPISKGLVVNQRHEEQLYYSGQYSPDGGQSWVLAAGLPFARHLIRDLAIEGSTWIGITSGAVVRSTDQGRNWQTIFQSRQPNYINGSYEATSVSYHKGSIFVNLFPRCRQWAAGSL